MAEKYDIGLVDALELFESMSPHGLLGYNFIIDGHHPNLNGYILLAKGFAEQVEKILGVHAVRRDVSSEEVSNHFNFGQDDLVEVYVSRTQWLLMQSLQVGEKEDRSQRAEYYLKKAEEIK